MSNETHVGDLMEALKGAASHKPFTVSQAGRGTVYGQTSTVG